MKNIFIISTVWFISLSITLTLSIDNNLPILITIRNYLIVNSIMSIIYWYFTNKLKNRKKPPLSYRGFVFILLFIYGPIGYFIYLFIYFYTKKSGENLYQKYKEYIQVKYDDLNIETTNYSVSLKTYLDREPIIDTLKYGDLDGRRGAAELLARMNDYHAIKTLKSLTTDDDPSIRFIATSKLSNIENKFMEDMEWYSQIIKICGNEPEILLQYGYLIIEFVESGLVDNDMLHIYLNKSYKIFSLLITSKEFGEYAKMGLVITLRLSQRYKDAIDIIEFIDDKFIVDKISELAECYFQLRNFKDLRKLIKEYSNHEILKNSKFGEWIEKIKVKK